MAGGRGGGLGTSADAPGGGGAVAMAAVAVKAVVLAVLGRGFRLCEQDGWVFAIALSLAGFAGALAAPALGLPLLAAGFLAALVYDLRQVAGGRFPSWYKRLRIALTSCAVAALSGASAFAL